MFAGFSKIEVFQVVVNGGGHISYAVTDSEFLYQQWFRI